MREIYPRRTSALSEYLMWEYLNVIKVEIDEVSYFTLSCLGMILCNVGVDICLNLRYAFVF